MRVEEQLTINAPAERVWEVITDPHSYTRLMRGITRNALPHIETFMPRTPDAKRWQLPCIRGNCPHT